MLFYCEICGLGSTRAVVNNSGALMETFDYYPFGLLMPGRNTASAETRELFTGQERDTEAGFNLDYFGARYYDAAIGRFPSVDPLADEYPGWSPYVYTLNNPLIFIDPTGLCPENYGGGSACIEDFGFENTGIFGRIINYLLATDPEIGGQSFNSVEFAEIIHEGVVDEAGEIVEIVADAAETGIGVGILVSDGVSTASDLALPAAFMFGPKAVGIVGGIGTAADVTSTVLKGVDLLMFDGTQEVFRAQAIKTGFNFTKAEGLKKIRQSQK